MAGLQQEQGPIWQVFSSPNPDSKDERKHLNSETIKRAVKCSCHTNGNCGAARHELLMGCNYRAACALDRPKHFLSYFLFCQKESTAINSKLLAESINNAIGFMQQRHY